jgi:hypothetical protein
MTPPNIPIVRVLQSGREFPIGLASTPKSAEKLLADLMECYPHYNLYIDWSRTAEDVLRESGNDA